MISSTLLGYLINSFGHRIYAVVHMISPDHERRSHIMQKLSESVLVFHKDVHSTPVATQ